MKLAIKGSSKYKTQDEAASALGMSRQNLSIYFKKKILDDEFLQNVNKKLGIILKSQSKPTNDFFGGVNEPTVLYERLLKSKDDQIALLNKRIEELEDKYKPPLQLGKTGGRRN